MKKDTLRKIFKHKTLTYLRKLMVWFRKRKKKCHDKNYDPNLFQDLSPNGSPEEATTYYEALEWALETKTIKNISVCGCYGSGKSSVINGFFNTHKKYKNLKISLASFNTKTEKKEEQESNNGKGTTEHKGKTPPKVDDKDKCSTPNNELDQLLEQSILQQIVYSTKGHKLPYSRFKRISNVSFWKTFAWTGLLVLWLASLFVFLKLDFLKNIPHWDVISSKSWILYTALAISVVILFCGLFHFKRLFANIPLNKLKIQNYEIELGEKIATSILNKYLDEVLYFFEKTGYQVLVFEDIDRYNNTNIFTKLRELNILINNAEQVSHDVKFIYAIKDDMFKEEERTKFFDFVIPIIPHVNCSNTGSKLYNMLGGSESDIDENFIQDISIYIHDMRMLKNIANEYNLYSKILAIPVEKKTKLLAMIAYKNKYPSDFVELHYNRGVIADTFNIKKSKLIKSKIDALDDEIEALAQEIKKSDEHAILDIIELRKVYLAEFLIKYPDAKKIVINENEIDFNNILTDDNFQELSKQSDISYIIYNKRYGGDHTLTSNSNISFHDLETAVNPNLTYTEREDLIKNKEFRIKNEKELLIIDYKNEIDRIKHYRLKDLCKLGYLSVLELNVEDLPAYLLKNGHIDEDYFDYISFFIEGKLTRTDNNYIESIKGNGKLDFEYKLNKIENILERLSPSEMNNLSALNIDLLNYLYKHENQHTLIRKALINHIKEEKKDTFDFAIKYIEKGNYADKFIKELCSADDKFWNKVYNSNEVSSVKENILKLMISELYEFTIKYQNSENNISSYLEENSDTMLSLDDDKADKMCETLKFLNIKFSKLNPEHISPKIFDYIYDNNLYQINVDVIGLMFNQKLDIDINSEDFKTKNYTTILNSIKSPLFNYINDEIQTYITKVFFQLPENKKEDEYAIASLINDDRIKIEDRKRIIDISENKIKDASTIENEEMLSYLFETSSIEATWNNVANYYARISDLKIDDTLLEFLNTKDNYELLSEHKIENIEFDGVDNLEQKLSTSLILNTQLTDDAYKLLYSCRKYTYEPLDFNVLPESRIKLLIKSGYLLFSADRADYIKENFYSLYINYLERYKEEFLEKCESEFLDKDIRGYISTEFDLAGIINSMVFSNEEKVQMIESLYNDINFTKKDTTNIIVRFLLKNEINTNISNIKEAVSVLGVSEYSILLLCKYIDSMDIDDIQECLDSFGEPYSKFLTQGSRRLKMNEANENLTSKLKERDLISPSSGFNEKYGMIQVNGKKRG